MKNSEKLFSENQKLVYHVTKQFHNLTQHGLDMDDINQLGMIGLWKASEAFDESKGIKFATFAVPVIRNNILMTLRKNNGVIRVPSERYSKGERAEIISFDYCLVNSADGSVTELHEIIADPYDMENDVEFQIILERVLSRQNSRTKHMFHLLKMGYTQKEISSQTGISQTQISRILKKFKASFMWELRRSDVKI